jgi:hypothetical protein
MVTTNINIVHVSNMEAMFQAVLKLLCKMTKLTKNGLQEACFKLAKCKNWTLMMVTRYVSSTLYQIAKIGYK